MKSATLSILIGFLGIIFLIWFNYQTLDFYQENINNHLTLSPTLVTSGKMTKLISIVIGFLGLFFGIHSIIKKNKIGIIGVIMSIIVIILIFFPLWTLMI